MIASSRYPSLYQVNSRVWLTELSRKIGRTAILDDIPDVELDRIAEMGFDWGLVPECVADRFGGAESFTHQRRVAQRILTHAARSQR
jgi:hypothetical protein